MQDISPQNETPASIFKPFLQALLDGDSDACARITHKELANDTSVLWLYQHLYQAALYRVGELWSANRVSVATEHMATAIVEGLLNQVHEQVIRSSTGGRKVLLATLENELHQVGAKMAGDVFEMHGWDSVFVGAGLPTRELLLLIDEERPDILGLSFSIYFHLDTLHDMVTRIRAEQPELPILLGGQGLQLGGDELAAEFTGITCIHSLDELDDFITRTDQSHDGNSTRPG